MAVRSLTAITAVGRGFSFANFETRFEPALEAQVSRKNGAQAEAERGHASFIGFTASPVRFEALAPGDEGNPSVPVTVQVADDLVDSRLVVNAEIAHVAANRRRIEER